MSASNKEGPCQEIKITYFPPRTVRGHQHILIPVIKLLRVYSPIGLKEAKDLCELAMLGQTARLKLRHGESPVALLEGLRGMGVFAEVASLGEAQQALDKSRVGAGKHADRLCEYLSCTQENMDSCDKHGNEDCALAVARVLAHLGPDVKIIIDP